VQLRLGFGYHLRVRPIGGLLVNDLVERMVKIVVQRT
jgi:hypothetical protein